MSLGLNFGAAIATVDDPPGVGGHFSLVDYIPEDIAVACLVDFTVPEITSAPWTRDATGEHPTIDIIDVERLTVRRWAPIVAGRSSMANDLAVVVVNVLSLG